MLPLKKRLVYVISGWRRCETANSPVATYVRLGKSAAAENTWSIIENNNRQRPEPGKLTSLSHTAHVRPPTPPPTPPPLLPHYMQSCKDVPTLGSVCTLERHTLNPEFLVLKPIHYLRRRPAAQWRILTRREALDDLPLKGRDRAIVSQTNTGTASKATLGKLLKDGVGHMIMGLSEGIDTILK